jgi:glucose/arabinose dehydrogenase
LTEDALLRAGQGCRQQAGGSAPGYRPRSTRRGLLTLAAAALALAAAAPASAETLPPGFADEPVAPVPAPTAMAFLPDGRLLVTTKDGRLLVRSEGTSSTSVALDLRARVCTQLERGLVGVAVDPGFAVNRLVYLYYTRRGRRCDGTAVNRVSRFVLAGTVVDRRSERVLIDRVPSPSGMHQAGDLEFGRDGFLYVSIGDGACHYRKRHRCGRRDGAARERNVLLGKILRIDRSGRAPAANGGGVRCARRGLTRRRARCREIFATGLRNPFRIAFDPNAAGARFFINDVGSQTTEEIDLGQLGADYGWNLREGSCPVGTRLGCGPAPRGLTNPIFEYPHSTGCRTITGGSFVPAGAWPAELQGDYLFADYGCGKIFRLEPLAGGGYRAVDFVTDLGRRSAVHLAFGPSPSGPALYYTTFAGGGVGPDLAAPRGQVRRIVFGGP